MESALTATQLVLETNRLKILCIATNVEFKRHGEDFFYQLSVSSKLIKAAKKANPLTSDVILTTNSSQATLMYFIVFTQAVIEGLHTLKCQEIFIDKLAKNKDIVRDTGDTGYNPCKKKAKQLKLADKVGGKSVDIQYKDPGTTYRLWGSEHHAAKGIVFYEIHSLVNKQNAAGQNYSVLSTATSNP